MTTALITGIGGQDGRYLAEFLTSKNYTVYGFSRSKDRSDNHVSDLRAVATVIQGDVADSTAMKDVLERVAPDEIYNLAAVSSLAESEAHPETTWKTNGESVAHLLRLVENLGGTTRVCQASSSLIFGPPDGRPRNEQTPLNPMNVYAEAKAFATSQIRESRDRGQFAANAILFNHESPRRPARFVSRKISRGVALVKLGLAPTLRLDNLSGRRDWGFAGDYVRAMWAMLQADHPDDYVIATGTAHSVKDLVQAAFAAAGIDKWEGLVQPTRQEPPESVSVGDITRAHKHLNWIPDVAFEEWVAMMVENDLRLLRDSH